MSLASGLVLSTVIPDKRRSRADPGSIIEHDSTLGWIPDLRFAVSGMTVEDQGTGMDGFTSGRI
ncbi:hypothetical protein [Bosea sp. PAMC 26642]|uniref:hypothetical protein n=1 Tax=Bosea sp. (strain PAMC 26642) TaxID=1792307 RepID=UPI0012E72876|nr:hypothetical protein [Bosea sp. PAMC 26642]